LYPTELTPHLTGAIKVSISDVPERLVAKSQLVGIDLGEIDPVVASVLISATITSNNIPLLAIYPL
jgi:hypothetical protein